jgi:Kef-type K+ transport system membrane component KefB
LKEFVVNWFRHDAFGSHVGEWLALALAILVLFAVRIALSRLVFRFLGRKFDKNESEDETEREYWRIHGG